MALFGFSSGLWEYLTMLLDHSIFYLLGEAYKPKAPKVKRFRVEGL